MAKITDVEGKLPKRIDDFVIYSLDDDMIIRQKSGFNTKELLNHPKYQLCRQNANEFGLVSKTCKAIRVLLADFLTKHNNLQVVNSFTKKMRSLLVYDTIHERGNRNLKTALATPEAQKALNQYLFNPDFRLQFNVFENTLQVQLPEALNLITNGHLGMCVHYLFFDFDSLTGYSESTTWQMQPLKDLINFDMPESKPEGFWIRLIQFNFFSEKDADWVPILPEERGLIVF